MGDAKQAYDALITEVKQIATLGSCANVLGWDEQTYMPKGGVKHRSEQLALLAGLTHERFTCTQIGDWLAEVEGSDLVSDRLSVEAVNVRELRQSYDRETKLPKDLVQELARMTTIGQQAWAEARSDSDFAAFQPHLEKILDLKKKEAAALGVGKTPYDALLDEYEPGETTDNLTNVFSALRNELVELVGAIVDSGNKPNMDIVKRLYPKDKQAEFGQMVASQIGFDFDCGRLDETAHPFCSGFGPGDTRLTTRYDEHYFPQALFGTMHEAGHGIYDQGLNADYYGTPMGNSVSLGIHESQSRMWENFVGRSNAFWTHFFPKAQTTFPDALGQVSQDDFYFAVNNVEASFIRVEADEVTYNLHILLRFEMEQSLMNGGLNVADVPGVWNETFEKYFGITPPDDAHGCLQDIHWSFGGIGYFPTYTLGNLYAAQLFEQARDDVGDLDAQFAAGEFLPLKSWLNEKIHKPGQKYRASELVDVVTGKPLSHAPLIRHLKTKFGSLYGIG
ncbi:MAG: carboxypeptidase M32 [Candidatus Latescibacteria bacterium]|nr:carboxypeptidase M32 [Candidatus Latescibacterota bacterium]